MESYFLPWETEPTELKRNNPESVSDLTRRVKLFVEREFDAVYVEGEITDWKGPSPSGHVYFSLKDGMSQVACVIWKGNASRCDVRSLANGVQVEIRGKIVIYEARGNYQIVVSSLQRSGIGKLWVLFEQLKDKLSAEGMFREDRKRQIPSFPKVIGVVTSIKGAVLQDILRILKRRAPQINVLIYNVRVQGDGASKEISQAILRMNTLPQVEVLIVGRGGGSMQDLWAFNEEEVARAIAKSTIPVISAVGHETDVTIADFVADLRAPTPSAAAEIVSARSSETRDFIQSLKMRSINAMNYKVRQFREIEFLQEKLISISPRKVETYKLHLDHICKSRGFIRPFDRVQIERQRLDDYREIMKRLQDQRLGVYRHSLTMFEAKLNTLNPLAILRRGYSIVYDVKNGKVLTDAGTVENGDVLDIRLHSGMVRAAVTEQEEDLRKKIPQKRAKKPVIPDQADDLFGDLNDWGV